MSKQGQVQRIDSALWGTCRADFNRESRTKIDEKNKTGILFIIE